MFLLQFIHMQMWLERTTHIQKAKKTFRWQEKYLQLCKPDMFFCGTSLDF